MASNKTPNLGLDVWAELDYFKRAEVNNNFTKVDSDAAQNGINVFWYGVDLTGVKDSSVAFQNAVNYANSSGIKKIKLPKGTISIGTKITSYQGLVFEGNNTVIKGINGVSKFTDALSQNTFKNITFDNFGFGVQATDRENVNFVNCKFLNIATVGVYYYNTKNSIVSNCFFNNITKDSINIDGTCDNILVENSEFNNPLQYGGYSIEQTTAHVNVLSGNNVRVFNNKIFNNGGQGVIFSYNPTLNKGATHCKAVGNYCEGNGQEGITSFGGPSKLASNNIISGNTCKNNRFHQIEVWSSNQCVINGNVVDESDTYGNMGAITLYNTNNSTCLGNVILNASNNGIAVLAGSKKTVISTNTIKGTNGKNDTNTPEKGQGILLDSNGSVTPSEITVSVNVIESKDTTKTSVKNGIYSTNQNNQFNKIEGNSTFGYLYEVHQYALTSCKNKALAKPTGTTGYYNNDFVEKVGSNAESGTAGSKYILVGWKLVGGVWLEQRFLTGN